VAAPSLSQIRVSACSFGCREVQGSCGSCCDGVVASPVGAVVQVQWRHWFARRSVMLLRCGGEKASLLLRGGAPVCFAVAAAMEKMEMRCNGGVVAAAVPRENGAAEQVVTARSGGASEEDDRDGGGTGAGEGAPWLCAAESWWSRSKPRGGVKMVLSW